MARRIKLHSLHILFNLFAFLADKTGGWRVFVKPKILLGSLLVGIGLTTGEVALAQKPKTNSKNPIKEAKDSVRTINHPISICYDVMDPKDTVRIYETADQMPQYPGGSDSLFSYLSNKMTPRVIAQCYNSLVGTVVCRFVVEKDGSLSHIEIIKSLYVPLDKEAVEIIKGMPKWIPGRQNGNAVRAHYTLPIKFRPE